MRSCGGPLASAWQLASAALPDERLDDADYVLIARALLGQDLAPAECRTCRCRRTTGASPGELCGAPLCRLAHHAYRCAVGGGLKTRSEAVERVYKRIHEECGYHVDTQPHVPEWDRWHWHCTGAGCTQRGVSYTPLAPTCAQCGSDVESRREEAILDLEVRNAEVPRVYLDVTVRHAVPSDAVRLRKAANHDGATNKEAENDKADRYPAHRCSYKAVPLAVEMYGRHGTTALKYLRKLARKQASRLDEGGDEVVGALVLRWGRRLSVAL